MYKRILLLVSVVFTAAMTSEPPRVNILVPVALSGAVPGAFGSVWRSETTILNRGSDSYFIGPWPSCPLSAGCDVFAEMFRLLPDSTRVEDITGRFAFSQRSYGALLNVEQSHLSDLVVETRVWDASRAALNWGARIPSVPETAAETGAVDFTGVMTASPFRSMLRLYDFDPAAGHSVRVRTLRTSEKRDVVIAERTLDFQPNRSSGAIDRSFSGYAELDLTSFAPNEQSVRVQIEPATPGLRYYALISVTNNDTQYLTVLTPPPHASPPVALLRSGTWGGANVSVAVSSDEAVFTTTGCVRGHMVRPTIGADGTFRLDAAMEPLGGPPPPPGSWPAAIVVGRVSGDVMTWTATYPSGTVLGPFSATYGAPLPTFIPCPV